MKKLLLGVCLIVSVVLISVVTTVATQNYLNKGKIVSDTSTITTAPTITYSNTPLVPTASPTVLPTDTPKPILKPTSNPSPKFTVTILTHLDLNNNFLNSARMNLTVKNISVQPYITAFYLEKCTFVDGANVAYQGKIALRNIDSISQKAILPGEERVFQDVNTNISIRGLNEVLQKCGYDVGGSYVCTKVDGLKVTQCDATVRAGTDNNLVHARVNFP